MSKKFIKMLTAMPIVGSFNTWMKLGKVLRLCMQPGSVLIKTLKTQSIWDMAVDLM